MKTFNGIDIENVVTSDSTSVNTAIGNVYIRVDGSINLAFEVEDFLKYLKAKYS